MSNKILFVPIHLDALLLEKNQQVTEARANFTNLPYFNGSYDINANIANIGESIISGVFSNQNLTLKKGVHLHWSFPDTLTNGIYNQDTDQIEFPAVPNRWLIRRTEGRIITGEWIIESDYLHPEGEDNKEGAIAYPIDIDLEKQSGERKGVIQFADPSQRSQSQQPFRYLGRQIHFDASKPWQEESNHDRLKHLTAVGYGEQTFAAFYPNCHSVFGSHDPKITTQTDLIDLQYDLIGWYSDLSKDPLHQKMPIYLSDAEADTEVSTDEEKVLFIQDKIQTELNWKLEDKITSPLNLPERIFCYSKISFKVKPNQNIANSSKKAPIEIALGNTPTEALSAYLGQKMASDPTIPNITDKTQTEQQLEALQLFKKLATQRLDRAATFKEEIHKKRFTAVNGGNIWVITETRKQANDPTYQTEPEQKTASEISLPKEMAHHLNELNQAEQAVFGQKQEIISLKQQLFSDWYKYMLSTYPPDDSRDNYPSPERIQQFIEERDIRAIDQATLDLIQLQAYLSDKQQIVQSSLDLFNQSKIESSVLDQKLDQEINDAENLLAGGTWIDNKPFSEKAFYFDGENHGATLHQAIPIQAISLWVKIAGKQKDGAALLNLASATDAAIGTAGIGRFWSAMYINGKQQDPYLPLHWLDIPKDRWVHLHLAMTESFTGQIYLMAGNNGIQLLKGALTGVRFFSRLLSEDEIYTDMNMLGKHHYSIQQQVADRFWQPNEPVVLFVGDSAKATQRHNSDGRLNEDQTLSCQTPEFSTDIPTNPSFTDLQNITDKINNYQPTSNKDQIGFSQWNEQPWNPFMMEWEVELFPLYQKSNLRDENRNYDPAFITHNTKLRENSPEIKIDSNSTVTKAAAIYQGSSILTPHAKLQLVNSLEKLLNTLKESDYFHFETTPIDAATTKSNYSTRLHNWYIKYQTQIPGAQKRQDSSDKSNQLPIISIADFKSAYLLKPVHELTSKFTNTSIDISTATFDDLATAEQGKDAIYTAILAYKEVQNHHLLSQALGGFNAALLMQKQSMQLPINEPIGFSEQKAFTERVRNYVGKESKVAPLPVNDFNPIRSGSMSLLRLSLIDTFGQVKSDFDLTRFTRPNSWKATGLLAGDGEKDRITFPPAFTQATRLNWRWLSADPNAQTDQEMNSHPASSPICGWILPNYLDSSLMFYDQGGDLLGLINQQAVWESGPGNPVIVKLENIPNPALKKVIQKIVVYEFDDDTTTSNKVNFLQDFISVLGKALENIDPENYAAHQDLALLMGRPIAVVRASLNLEVQGELALNQSWNRFRKDIENSSRDTDLFEKVQVPIRIGERAQLCDGIVGYWKEDPEKKLKTSFYTTVAKDTDLFTSDEIKTYEDNLFAVTQSISSPATTITMLLDPRGTAHVTTGILPTKVISIPPDQYAKALENISITFLSAPIFTPKNTITLPLPNEPGYNWSWFQKERFHWNEISKTGIITKDKFIQTFEQGATFWEVLKTVGWIVETESGNKAKVIPVNQRKAGDAGKLPAEFLKESQKIQDFLDQGHISSIQTQATFEKASELREGWLKLSPQKS